MHLTTRSLDAEFDSSDLTSFLSLDNKRVYLA